ncbi:DNA (cytosine-5-)-methyltransferase, partial [Porticoccaceae bacterium]|nr:DNA (cytosine-5-)-methyltransferase [Porticoccaceae bacterium]
MKYISVCSGIEAATAAWHELGWTPAWFSEIEPFPSAVLQHHYPEVPNLGDMTKFMEWPDESIELLVGGTPCQSFSVAGLRKGLDDPRGNLALTYIAIAAKYRPKWVVWENVLGVFSATSHGAPDPCAPPPPLDLELDGQEMESEDDYRAEELHAFLCFLAGLSEIGYGVAYRVFDAQYSGVPQRRRRVFVVGCLGDWAGAAAVLSERHSLQGHSAPRREKGEAAPTIPARSSAGGGLGTDFDCDGGLIAGTLTTGMGRRRGCGIEPGLMVVQPFETANCLTSRMAKGMNSTVDEGQTPIVVHGTQDPNISDQAHTLGRNAGQENVLVIPINDKATRHQGLSGQGAGNGLGVGEAGDPLPTLTAGDKHAIFQPTLGVRRLLPIECDRLQGFSDNYTQIPWRGK